MSLFRSQSEKATYKMKEKYLAAAGKNVLVKATA
jgi:hypothetical protein